MGVGHGGSVWRNVCSFGRGGRYLDDQGVLGPQGVRGLERQGCGLGGQGSYSYRYVGRADPVPYS